MEQGVIIDWMKFLAVFQQTATAENKWMCSFVDFADKGEERSDNLGCDGLDRDV